MSKDAWWEKYRGQLPEYFLRYIESEQTSFQIYSFHNSFVVGILQTESYARALMDSLDIPGAEQENKDLRVACRLERQWHFFEREKPVHLRCILDESVLYRPIGGQGILYEQLRHLLSMAELPGVNIQIATFNRMASWPLLYFTGIFELLYRQGHKLELWREEHTSVLMEDHDFMTTYYEASFQRLERLVLSPKESMQLIAKVADRLEKSEFQDGDALAE